MKQVQIPYELFLELFRYFGGDSFKTPEREQYIREELTDKMERIAKHNSFTKHTAP